MAVKTGGVNSFSFSYPFINTSGTSAYGMMDLSGSGDRFCFYDPYDAPHRIDTLIWDGSNYSEKSLSASDSDDLWGGTYGDGTVMMIRHRKTITPYEISSEVSIQLYGPGSPLSQNSKYTFTAPNLPIGLVGTNYAKYAPTGNNVALFTMKWIYGSPETSLFKSFIIQNTDNGVDIIYILTDRIGEDPEVLVAINGDGKLVVTGIVNDGQTVLTDLKLYRVNK